MRNVGAVILAAGGSSRLGQPKQLLLYRGETLIRRAVRAAAEAGCHPVVLVVSGELGDAVRSEADLRDSSSPALRNFSGAMIVENANWRNGVGTSIRRGLQEFRGSVEAVVLLACDQPFLDRGVIGELIAMQEKTGKPIIASSYANTLGVPALFDRSLFAALVQLPDDSGAKTLIAARPGDVGSIAFKEGAVDVDTPQDFERLKEIVPKLPHG